MSASALYPCEPWPINTACCEAWPADVSLWTEEHCRAQMLATIQLWRAVAGSVGLCRVVEAPCLDRCANRPLEEMWMQPYLSGGNWYNKACGDSCPVGCSCSKICTVTLQEPVHRILRVTIDGEKVDRDDYKLLTGARLARRPGECWPGCQGYFDDDGLRVEYMLGVPPGPDAIDAVSLLACRKLRECSGADHSCGVLPSRVTSVAREGMTMSMDSSSSPGEQALMVTGIARVDAWIASINPYGIDANASVWSPDVETPQLWERGRR